MARKPRIHFPGACYHVILRGNAGQDVFSDDQDRSRFCLLVQEGVEKFKHRVLAYCLMTNHIHLAIQVDEIPLSRIIQNLSFRYTRYNNYQRQQIGHLFQGRYKAILIDADSYLLELVKYIHNNPVHAGMVKTADKYPWSSHTIYLGEVRATWLSTHPVLSQFASIKTKALTRYQEFILKESKDSSKKELDSGNYEGRILGSDRFIEEALIKTGQQVSSKVTISQILKAVSKHYSINPDELKRTSKQRRLTEARAVASLIVREMHHLHLADLSRKLDRDLSGLSQAAGRLEKKLRDDSELSKNIQTIKATLK